MKQFLYLDNDIVASIIAQSEKGIITQMTNEMGRETGRKRRKSVSANAEASGSGKLWKVIEAAAKLGINGQFDGEKSSSLSSRAIVEKTLHDASFDIAYDHIQPVKADGKNDDAGEYVEIKRVFTFVDLDSLEGLFGANGAINYIKELESKKIESEVEAAREGYSRDQWRKVSSSIQKELKRISEQNSRQYDDAATIIKLIKSLVPSSRMLLSYDGFLIPLDDKYFRIDPANLGFKYGGEMTCVGLITNIIGESTDPGNDKDIFASIQFSVNEVLRAILPTKDKDLCVVHPIAVYYGE